MARLLFLAFALFLSSGAFAQSPPYLQVLVEDLHDAARTCGITEDVIKTPVVLTLRNNRIFPAQSSVTPYLYVNVNVLHDSSLGRCTYGVDVSIRDIQLASNRNGFMAEKAELVILCERRTIGYAHKSAIAKHLSDSIEQLTKQCIATVNY